MRAERESHLDSRSEDRAEAEAEEAEYWRKKTADERAKKRSEGKGRSEVV